MSTPAAIRQPAPRSALKRLVARHPVAAFLVMVYAVTIGFVLPRTGLIFYILPKKYLSLLSK